MEAASEVVHEVVAVATDDSTQLAVNIEGKLKYDNFSLFLDNAEIISDYFLIVFKCCKAQKPLITLVFF